MRSIQFEYKNRTYLTDYTIDDGKLYILNLPGSRFTDTLKTGLVESFNDTFEELQNVDDVAEYSKVNDFDLLSGKYRADDYFDTTYGIKERYRLEGLDVFLTKNDEIIAYERMGRKGIVRHYHKTKAYSYLEAYTILRSEGLIAEDEDGHVVYIQNDEEQLSKMKASCVENMDVVSPEDELDIKFDVVADIKPVYLNFTKAKVEVLGYQVIKLNSDQIDAAFDMRDRGPILGGVVSFEDPLEGMNSINLLLNYGIRDIKYVILEDGVPVVKKYDIENYKYSPTRRRRMDF